MANLFTSSIGKKLIMSITGIFLYLFLTFHMLMNLTAVFSANAYDMICEMLGANWYALVATVILAAGVLVHFLYATILTLSNLKARGKQRYEVTASHKGVTWASKNMYILGGIVILGLILHLYNFWYNMQFSEIIGKNMGPHHPTEGTAHIADLFSSPVYCLVYLFWLAALWFHLTHGIWSSLQTIGWSSKVWMMRVKWISYIYATLIISGFVLVVVVFYLRSLGVPL